MSVVTIDGKSALIAPTVTVSTSPAYTAGDVVGGALAITSAATRVSSNKGGTAVLLSLSVIETGTQKPALDILLFSALPTGTYTDNVAPTISTADIANCMGKVSVLAADYNTVGTLSIATLAVGVVIAVGTAVASTTIYAVPVTSGTPTFSATTSLQIKFGFLQD